MYPPLYIVCLMVQLKRITGSDVIHQQQSEKWSSLLVTLIEIIAVILIHQYHTKNDEIRAIGYIKFVRHILFSVWNFNNSLILKQLSTWA